jgi:hypothetical protein
VTLCRRILAQARTLAAVCLLLGCASTLPCEQCPRHEPKLAVTLCVDSAFADSEQAAIVNAARAWEDALCGYVRITTTLVNGAFVPSECGKTILRVQSSYAWVAASTPANVPGFSDGCCTAWLVVDRAGDRLDDVAAHEIGHLLGVDHGSGLMAARMRGDCIDRRAAVLAALTAGNR